MKKIRYLVLFISLIIVYSIILWIPTVTVEAIYQSQKATIQYSIFYGMSNKCISKGEILFYLDFKLLPTILVFCFATIATILISLKKGRLLGLFLYFVTLLFLSLNVDVAVFSQTLKNESCQIHEQASFFLLIHLLIFIMLYLIQTLIIKREIFLEENK